MGNRGAIDATSAVLEEQVGADSALMASARALAADFSDAPAAGGDTGVDLEPSALEPGNDLDFDLGFGTADTDNLLDTEEQTLDWTLT